MADSDVVLDEFLRDVGAAETIGRWLNGSERVALVTGVLVEEWDPSGHNNLASEILKKRKIQMTFRFKPIKSADWHSTIKDASQIPHSETDRPSLSKPSVMALSNSYSTQASPLPASLRASPLTHEPLRCQTSPLQQRPLERSGSDERPTSRLKHNVNQGTKSYLSDSEPSSTIPFCEMVAKTVRTVFNAPTTLFRVSPQDKGTISYQCQWDLLSFLQENFDNKQEISGAVTLVGTSSLDDPCAITCEEYMYRTWPRGGRVMLQVMERLFKSVKRETVAVINGDLRIWLGMVPVDGHDNWVLDFTGPVELQVEVAQTLCWLAATFRSSAFPVTAESRAALRVSSLAEHEQLGVHLVLSLTDLVPLSGLTMCWPPLLAHTPIAVPFPVPQRKEGIGLEMSPLLMARLAGIVMVVEFQGGLILKGLSTALIPINYCNGGAAIQWHLLHTISADGFLNDLEYTEDFLTIHHPAILFQKKAYLGWCKGASILLGTSVYNYPAVSWSTSTPERSQMMVSGFSLGLASNGLGFFGPSATMNFTVAKSQRTRYMDIEQQLEDRLKLSVTKPALVYDTSTQRAWLVPVTCPRCR
ncbi:MAG: hypothetical protein Q9226_004288 [Calogaya cf. arnoldii]